MEERIYSLAVLCLVFAGVGAITVKIEKETYEFARGDNITLPCSFQTKIASPKLVIITWTADDIGPNPTEVLILTHYSSSGITDIKNKYEGRVSLDVDIPQGKANLKLSSITLADNKIFQCRIQVPGDDEGTPYDRARLVVLVAPSKPICNIQGKAEYGQNINLTCHSEEGSPPPVYKWQSQDVRHTPRRMEPRTIDKGGILSLFNISKDTSGYYLCTSSNKIRSATCNLTLSVMPPSMNIGSTAGIIGGVVAALIVLIIIIYCCCCRKKNKEEEYAMGVREEAYTDKEPARNGESRRDDDQEDPQAYDDSSVRRPAERSDRYEERSERGYDHRKEYDDRRSDYDDRRSDYDDRRSDYSDRRDRYSDRHERYDDDRRYDDDDRRYDDSRDRRYDDDRYDEPYDDRARDRSPAPAPPNNKPPRRDYDD